MKLHRLLTALITSMYCLSACAHDTEDTPGRWDGSTINAGGVLNTGNTDSSSLTGALKLKYEEHRWINTLNLNGQYGKNEGETNAQMYSIENKTQYSLNDMTTMNNFIYVDTDTTVNPFNSYDFTSTLTAGYGRDWIKNKKFTLSTSIAPGYNRSSVQNSDDVEDSWAAVSNLNLAWKISDTTKLTQDNKLSVFQSYYETNTTTSLDNKLHGNLSLVLSYAITYFSEIPEGTDYTDKMNTMTNISLSYTF